jgi:hypothetical protein
MCLAGMEFESLSQIRPVNKILKLAVESTPSEIVKY